MTNLSFWRKVFFVLVLLAVSFFVRPKSVQAKGGQADCATCAAIGCACSFDGTTYTCYACVQPPLAR